MVFAFHQRIGGRAFSVLRRIVWFLCLLVILAFACTVFLNVHGVPKPLLSSLVDRLNKSGVPLDIDRVNLTLHGWRAEKLRYYSGNPDDLDPLFLADEVFLKRSDRKGPERYSIHVTANDVTLTPSVAWCAGLPRQNILQHVDSLDLSVDFSPGKLVVRDGSIAWGKVLFNVDGTILMKKNAPKLKKTTVVEGETRPPLRISPEWYERIENGLKAFASSGGVVVDIDFLFDAANLSSSHGTMSARCDAFSFRDVTFNHAELAASYDHSSFRLERFAMQKESGTLEVNGSYDVASRLAQIRVANDIASKRMFLLFPDRWLAMLSKTGTRADFFPEMDVRIGPAVPEQLLQRLEGSISINNIGCWDLDVSSLSGEVKRTGSRLEFSQVKGMVNAQSGFSGQKKSCMQGGTCDGNIFWDSEAHEFGVSASTGFDPNLLLSPLSFCHIATNVISRFSFDDQPPQIQLELGACYDEWSSFYIKIRGSSSHMRLHEAPFSSLNVSSSYRDEVLTLDPFVAKQGGDFVKGSASLDFRNGVAGFDVTGSLNPKAIEGVICPDYGIFSKYVKVSGTCKITGQGCVDWRQMRATSFSGQVEAQRVELPMASLDEFSATVSGDGPIVQIKNAAFNVYGGSGAGMFSLLMDPSKGGIPYKADVAVGKADFNKGLEYLYPGTRHSATGILAGNIQVAGDFSQPFFSSANGKGCVDIRHGQLADLPLFRGFSSMMRMVIPSFKVFSINRISGDFELKNGVIYSKNAYFEGDLLSAKGRGSYSSAKGFDAYVQTQIFSDNNFSKIFRFFTDPFFKLLEVKLEGTFKDPVWKLDTFSFGTKAGSAEE